MTVVFFLKSLPWCSLGMTLGWWVSSSELGLLEDFRPESVLALDLQKKLAWSVPIFSEMNLDKFASFKIHIVWKLHKKKSENCYIYFNCFVFSMNLEWMSNIEKWDFLRLVFKQSSSLHYQYLKMSYCSCLKDIWSKVKLTVRPSEGVGHIQVSKANKSGSLVTSKLAVLTKGGTGYLKQMSSPY